GSAATARTCAASSRPGNRALPRAGPEEYGTMAHALRLIALAAAAFALQGCLAKAAVDVATLPVKAASAGVDLATTSQSEADQKRGREIRQREERLGRLQRDYDKQIKRCGDGNRR